MKFKPDIKISAMYGGFVVETRDRQDGDTVCSVFTTPDQVAQHIKRALVSYEGPGIPLEGGAFDRMKIGG